MAFMIIAIVIFFSMAALIYFSVSVSQARGTAEDLAEEEAVELAFSLSGTPELLFTAGSNCASCIDLDKAFAMSELDYYDSLWNLDYLQIEKVYPKPSSDKECSKQDYRTDSCKFITIKDSETFTAKTAIVTLAIRDSSYSGGYRYELGRIHVSA